MQNLIHFISSVFSFIKKMSGLPLYFFISEKARLIYKNDIKSDSEGGGPNGMLMTSEGSGSTAFIALEIQSTIQMFFKFRHYLAHLVSLEAINILVLL